MKIALGTVQLGIPYGNSSDQSLMPEEAAFSILEAAIQAGIRFFDTAIAYGLSEERIGRFQLALKSPESLISTKIPVAEPKLWKDPDAYWKWIADHIEGSKRRLGINGHTLLQFHQCDLDFLTHPQTKIMFKRLKDEGFCESVGVSVYSPDQALAALATGAVKALQVPANMIDTRFIEGAVQDKARARGVTLIGRSLFLKGVLIESAALPPVKKRSELSELRRLAKEASSPDSIHTLSVRYIMANHPNSLDFLLLGIDSTQSLRQNLELFASANTVVSKETCQRLDKARAYAGQHGLLNPANWNS